MPTPLTSLKAALLFVSLGMAACSAEQAEHLAQTDQRPGTNFAVYKTYNFMDETARNDSAFQRSGTGIFDLKRAVAHEMESRGFQRATQPDLWVNIGIVTQQKDQTRETNFRQDGAPYYIGQRNYHWQAQDVVVGQYQEGTATVDIVDAARKEQVWQGTTTSILSRNPDKSAKQIDEGVATIFRKFPVQPRQ
jgi:hypothetical protein